MEYCNYTNCDCQNFEMLCCRDSDAQHLPVVVCNLGSHMLNALFVLKNIA
jgi:hypothetical protein